VSQVVKAAPGAGLSSGEPAALPLSPMQQGLLLDSLRAGRQGPGVEQFVVRMPEAVDARRIENAFCQVFERYESLRCGFRWRGGLSQVVHADLRLPFTLVPIDADGGDVEGEFEAWLAEDRGRGFFLDAPPALRVALLRAGAEDHLLVFTFHHILMDGRSILRVVREAFAAYDGEPAADTSSGPKATYAEYLRHVAGLPTAASDDFFSRLFLGFPGPTPLPFGVLAGQGSLGPHRERSLHLSPARADLLRERAAELEVRSSSFMHAAWAVVLGRHAETDDVTFGGVRACRRSTVPGAEDIVGVLINTLPIRAHLGDGRSVRQLVLTRTRRSHISAAWPPHQTTRRSSIRS